MDETLNDPRLFEAIARWYPGTIVCVTSLRPGGRLLDPEIPGQLLKLRQPTFVTINYTDWNKSDLAHMGYCIVSLRLAIEEMSFVPTVLRQILQCPEYRTKRQRMGKVICWTKQHLFHYES